MPQKTFLSTEWKDSHIKQIKAKAGPRYTPKLNVTLPISFLFDGLTRNKRFYDSIRTHYGELVRCSLKIATEVEDETTKKISNEFTNAKAKLLSLLENIKEYSTEIIPWNDVDKECSTVEKIVHDLSTYLNDKRIKQIKETKETDEKKRPSLAEKIDYAVRDLYKVQEQLRFFSDFPNEDSAKLSNNKFLLIHGNAGSGKTHLLCDIAQQHSSENQMSSCALVFGESFVEGVDFWIQVAHQLGLSSYYQKKENLLKALDKAGKRSKSKSLFMIDALNESRPMEFWKNTLQSIYEEVEKYPNVVLVVSIRSGFEEETLPSGIQPKFVNVEHTGFRFREWEAVTKFFNEFELPLPEIPLLLPEFQNPLFLLLFCKAFSKRGIQAQNNSRRQVFRGHEGATYIFENFVKKAADKIAEQFNISKGRNSKGQYFIWDTIIDRVASEMVLLNDDRISEERFKQIVKEAHPQITQAPFIKALEKNLLIVKTVRYPRHEEGEKGFDYRFPFQKFSDHLRGRFIFKECKSSGKTPKQFFAKNTKLGKFISNCWDQGLIEALSIQCPEWYNGVEFFEVAPYMRSDLKGATFLESLIWRKTTAFSKNQKKLLKQVNEYIHSNGDGDSHVLNTLLTVAPIPNHPFNAMLLHQNLMRRPMPKRDIWWSVFVNYAYGAEGSVDRLISWASSEQDKTKIKKVSIKLCAIPIVWFLTNFNRTLRDKSTKALVSLLSDHLIVVTELLELFKKVDDSYLQERLFAVAYGCVLRNSHDKEGVKKIAEWIMQNFFHGKPFPDILMRDYARGIVEVAVNRNLLDITPDKFSPPYSSKWPVIPTEEELKQKYYPETQDGNREYYSIWSSVMYNSTGFPGDFGKYEINSALGYWSGRRLNRKHVYRKQLFEDFKKKLNSTQKFYLERLSPAFGYGEIIITIIEEKGSVRAQREEQEKRDKIKRMQAFKATLSKEKGEFFENEIEPYFDGHSNVKDPKAFFNTNLGQQWIFKHVIELGWTPKVHGKFDENISHMYYGRNERRVERIGKKYEWIALHQLLARVSDNFEFKKDSWSDSDEAGLYSGPWQIEIRDIDPSCILMNKPLKNIKGLPDFGSDIDKLVDWNRQSNTNGWLTSRVQLPSPKSIIEMRDNDNRTWMALYGYFQWEEAAPPEFEKYGIPRRQIWYHVQGYLIKNRDKKRFISWAKRQDFFNDWMPKSDRLHKVFLGEYPNSSAFNFHDVPYYYHEGWTKGRSKLVPVKILVANDEYASKPSSVDSSTDEAIVIKLPSKWLIDKMLLNHKYMDGRFFTGRNELIAFDPSLFMQNMPSISLIRKDLLMDYLDSKGLSLVWTVIGEKNVLGRDTYAPSNGWMKLNGAYFLDDDLKLNGSISSKKLNNHG